MSVLLVEDDEDDFVITRDLLASQSRTRFDVEWAASYEAAQPVIDDRRHDVYLIDYRLGALTGLDLVREMFAGEERAPVIILTGQGDYTVDLEATRLGITDFLLKDQLDAAVLERSIRYALSHHRALSALRLSQERYALAIRGANDGIWDWDLVLQRVHFASRWKAMLGHADGEIGDSPEDWFELVHPDDVHGLRTAIDAHLAGRTEHFESEHRIRHADGGYRWAFSRGVAIRDRDGKVTRMAGSMSDITDRKAAEERLLHNAMHDPLTGLPNRALFLDRLALSLKRAERRPEHRCTILFLDLDRFKRVNDGFSHAVGDQLLVALARRLTASMRPGDTVARFGGDEFTILLDDLGSTREAIEVAQRVQDSLIDPFRIDGCDLFITASVGISHNQPGSRPSELIRNADIAMYDAKRQGTARSQVFNVNMHSRAVSQMSLETELRRAIEEEQLRVFYQPIVDLGSGRLNGFEALARWPTDKPPVTPDEFIPVAEDSGLIGPLGRLVLNKACAQLSEWRDRGLVDDGITVAVNMSGTQLAQPDFISDVTAALQRSRLPARALRLELTENTIMHDPERMPATLAEFERIGVGTQIDDFGTGYSSLTFLHQFPGDTLKIDRSFIGTMHEDAGSEEIVRAIITLAHNLEIHTIAEGVDDSSQLKMLHALGCEYAQGFLFARPLEPGALETLIAAWDPRKTAIVES